MKMLLALVLSVSFAASSSARLGDNMDELQRRYGAPLDVGGDLKAPTSRWTFQDREYTVVVTMRRNRSVSEEITRRDRRDFTLQEVRDLLKDHTPPGSNWQEINGRQWRQGDWAAAWSDRTLTMQTGGASE